MVNTRRPHNPSRTALLEHLLGRLQLGEREFILRTSLKPSGSREPGRPVLGADSPDLLANHRLQTWVRTQLRDLHRLRDGSQPHDDPSRH